MEIVFVRHGKPASASNNKCDAIGFAQWVKGYDDSKIDTTFYPPSTLLNLCANSLLITSALPRAIHSAELVNPNRTMIKLALLNEMQLPCYRLPFTMPVSFWIFVNRFLWLIGFSANVESYKCAKQRARLMAEKLVHFSKINKRVVVFGHGLMNRQISKELVKMGWESNHSGKGYWSMDMLNKVN